MVKKNLSAGMCLLVFAVLLLATPPLGAATVSFLVIETGLPESGPDSRYSASWENGLLEVFFEAGHIVTNSPILRLNGKPAAGLPSEAEQDFRAARDGGMDYFVVAVVEHASSQNVSLRLFNTGSRNIFWEQMYTKAVSRTETDEYQNIKNAIKTMAAQIK